MTTFIMTKTVTLLKADGTHHETLTSATAIEAGTRRFAAREMHRHIADARRDAVDAGGDWILTRYGDFAAGLSIRMPDGKTAHLDFETHAPA